MEDDPAERRVWHKKPLSIVALYIFIPLLVYGEIFVPSPGKAVTVLAVAASVMTMAGEMGGREKVAWILLLFAFLFLELTSIEKERRANEDLRRQSIAQETESFSKIGEKIEKGITKSGKQFNASMGKTQESIDNLTGGKSYPEITVATFPIQGTANSFRLIFSIVGKNPLYDLDVNIRELPWPTTFNVTDFMTTGKIPGVSKVLSVPSFSPGIVQPFWAYFVTPSPDKVSDYQIVTHARNGKFVEILHLRKALDFLKLRGSIPSWEQSWEIKRNDKIIERVDWHAVECNGCAITRTSPLGIMQP